VKYEGEAETNGGEKDSTTNDANQEPEPKPKGSPVINSSSPPRPNSSGNALDASPTLSRPATAVAKTLSQLAAASKEPTVEEPGMNGGAESQDQSASTVSAAPAQTTQATSVLASGSNNSQASTNTLVNGYTSQPTTNHSASYSYTSGSGQPNGYHDDGEEDGIDLAKGFQPIGTFHQRNHLAISMGMAPAQASAFGR